ncbi:MAG: sulfite exporter TauE/SafE family protein [Rickettsiales bacterium]|nr:sulfite exporter TauE/SafE family protein [Rickettsiales bacterium]
MEWIEIIFLLGSAFLAGVINSVAGGGTFFTFPALIFVGVSPIVANVTSSIAVWPGAVASAVAYRKQLRVDRKAVLALSLTSVMGGAIGAVVLLVTPVQMFESLIPWLMLIATLLFAFGDKLRARPVELEQVNFTSPKSILLQLGIALYGGYFGAGIGILMLALLSLLGVRDIHTMNALKTVLGSAINGVAVVIFLFSGMVHWPSAGVMVLAAVIGGYVGAHYAQKMPKPVVKRFVIIVGVLMTAWFFGR